jgi:hypothetical protein
MEQLRIWFERRVQRLAIGRYDNVGLWWKAKTLEGAYYQFMQYLRKTLYDMDTLIVTDQMILPQMFFCFEETTNEMILHDSWYMPDSGTTERWLTEQKLTLKIEMIHVQSVSDHYVCLAAILRPA